MGQVEGKVAIVTGGACGIGAACARTLAREGAMVAVTDVDDGAGEGWSADISTRRRRCHLSASGRHRRGALAGGDRRGRAALPPARRDGGQCRHRHQGAHRRHDAGRLAPAASGEPRRRVPVGEACRAGHAARRQRSIIVMSSLAGLRGAAGLGGYCATKGGVRLLAKAAAIEHAEDKIRVEFGAPRHYRYRHLGQDGGRRRHGAAQRAHRCTRAFAHFRAPGAGGSRRRILPTACSSLHPRPRAI